MSIVIENNNTQWNGEDLFTKFRSLSGQEYRNVKNRRTYRFEENGRSYFCKYHSGVGWVEIFKNLITLRLPIISAGNEYRAIQRLQELGVATMTTIAFGQRGRNPARLESFIVTEELCNTVDLENYCADWSEDKPTYREKNNFITAISSISKTLHENGVCHRDYYLCHFLLHNDFPGKKKSGRLPNLSLIDLHRALIKRQLNQRWKIKDLAGLYFSAMDIGLTQRDIYRFIQGYTGLPLRQALADRNAFWRRTNERAIKMYKKHN